MALVLGIDPGTGSTSPLGVVAFDPETKQIAYAEQSRRGLGSDVRLRIQEVLKTYVAALTAHAPKTKAAYIESFVMRGKGGETLQRAIGAILYVTPESLKIIEVSNKQVKQVVGGHGASDKLAVGQGVLAYFKSNKDSAAFVKGLIKTEMWDLLDAFAIAITGLSKNA